MDTIYFNSINILISICNACRNPYMKTYVKTDK
jgi:hypothetical protein